MKKWFGIFIAVVCLMGIGAPAAMAQGGWAVDAEIGIFTDYTWTDEDAGDTKNFKVSPWDDLQFGAKYRGDMFDGNFNLKLDDNAGNGDYTAYFDKAVGTAKFSAFNVKFGLDDALSFNPVGSFRGKYGNSGIGSQIGGTKKYQVGIQVPVGKGMQIAALIAQPGQYWADLAGGVPMETTMPAVEVAFSAFTGFPWKVFAGYESNKELVTDETVTAYIVGAVVRPKIGPVNLNVVASYNTNFYQNQGSPWMTRAAFAGPYNWNYDPTQDTTKLGIAVGAEWMITEKFGLGAGGGYQVFNADDAGGIKYEDPMMSYWVEGAYLVTPWFRILPYFVVEDRGDLKAQSAITGGQFDGKQGVQYSLGVMWRFHM